MAQRRRLTRDWSLLAPAALLLAGLGLRLLYLFTHLDARVPGEPFDVARNFAATGSLANPFGAITGPTAHLLPLSPLVGGLVYSAFGVATPASEAILASWSIGLALLSFLLFYRAFLIMGSSPAAALGGLGALCLLPFYIEGEVVLFRLWEGALGAALAGGFLLALVRSDRSAEHGTPRIAALALLAAILFLVSPQLGLGAYAALAWFFVSRLPARQWLKAGAIAGLVFAAVLAPWLLRNERAVGAPVLRSNFGLELSVAFHPGALRTGDRDSEFWKRMGEVHPRVGEQALATLRRLGGEVAYSRHLGAATLSWMRANPMDSAVLALQHVRDYLFPPLWFWNSPEGPAAGAVPRMLIQWAITVLGLIGAASRALGAERRFRYAAVMLVVTILPFALVQPVLRYRYLVLALLVFFSADCVVRVASRWWAAAGRGRGTADFSRGRS